MAKLRIATFNINGIRSRQTALLQWLERESPDVVCLQELKAVDSAFPADALREAGYGAVWQGQSAWSGGAVCPASKATPIAAISRRRWAAC
jgi:exodeoxyribonuclease III